MTPTSPTPATPPRKPRPPPAQTRRTQGGFIVTIRGWRLHFSVTRVEQAKPVVLTPWEDILDKPAPPPAGAAVHPALKEHR